MRSIVQKRGLAPADAPPEADETCQARDANSCGPALARERVEHGVDHAGFLALEKGAGDIDIFLDRRRARARRRASAVRTRRRAEWRASRPRCGAAASRPGSIVVDRRSIATWSSSTPSRRSRKKRDLGRLVLVALDLARRSSASRTRRGFRSRPCRRPPSGRAPARRRDGRRSDFRAAISAPRRLRERYSASAARAASPPLSACADRRARSPAPRSRR